jgi:hypothetical protein
MSDATVPVLNLGGSIMNKRIDDDDDDDIEDEDDGEESIGTATLREDGTIHLRLIGKEDDGTHGEALIVVTPKEARYQRILAHLGDIKPGQSKRVKPFPPSTPTPP